LAGAPDPAQSDFRPSTTKRGERCAPGSVLAGKRASSAGGVGGGRREWRSALWPLPARRASGDDPGRGWAANSPVALEVGERLGNLSLELRPDLCRVGRREADQLGRGAERHVERDRLVQILAELDRQVAAGERRLREPREEELIADRVGVRHRERAGAAGGLLALLRLREVAIDHLLSPLEPAVVKLPPPH